MIAAQVAALKNLLRSHDAGGQAIQAHPTSDPDPMLPDGQEVGEEKTLCQARSAIKNLFYSVLPDVFRDERTGRFTHSDGPVRVGGDQGLRNRDEESSGDDDGYDADGSQQTIAGNTDHTTEGLEEGHAAHLTTAQLPIDNLDLLRRISDTEMRRLALDSERLTVEIRAVAAAEARVAQEARRLVMDEAKILALTESDTHKWTGVPTGYFETVVLFVQRDGRDGAAVIQSGKTRTDDTNRMRLDSKEETGVSVIFHTPIVTESDTLKLTCGISERLIVIGCTDRFGKNEALSLGPMDMAPLRRFEKHSINPFVARIKTPPNPTGEPSTAYEWE